MRGEKGEEQEMREEERGAEKSRGKEWGVEEKG